MVSITLSVPEETRQIMKKFPEMNWSGFIRKTIEEKAKALSWKEEMLKQWEKEKPLAEELVAMIRKGRKGRFAELKRKGIIK
ncbi:MAG: hypothetical protein V1740_01830 [Candidatus Woesearchaeota archaeon]